MLVKMEMKNFMKKKKYMKQIKKIQIKQNIFREDITEKINQKKEVFENKNLLLEQDILDHERQFRNNVRTK